MGRLGPDREWPMSVVDALLAGKNSVPIETAMKNYG
jgi:hypothetical protein